MPDIPGFRILRIAGKGGMGVVYEAQQNTPRRTVALKVLSRANSPEDLANFRREAQMIAGLEHPYIVPLYTFGENGGRPYLALRFLGGGTVAGRIALGPIDLKAASNWVQSIADALDFAHQRGVIHRDLKPSNILLDEAGNAYLSDFGIAGATAAATIGPPTGSAAYMSPEQGRGEPVDGRGDLYALAVTLFEMLTGRKPYEAETSFAVIVRHINDPIPSARAINPSVPVAVSDLIQWTMAKSPDDRPPSARQFAQLLRAAMSSPTKPIATLAAARQTRAAGAATMVAGPAILAAPRPTPRRPVIWVLIAAGALAACVGLGVLLTATGAIVLWANATTTPIPTFPPGPTVPIVAVSPDAPTPTQDPDGGVTQTDGTIKIVVRRNQVEWFWPVSPAVQQDGSLSASVSRLQGPLKNEMGLFCRWKDSGNGVIFAVSGEGDYRLLSKVGGTAIELVPWTRSAAIRTGTGETNTLKLDCNGPQISAAINGVAVQGATDPGPSSGQVGVMAGLREDGLLVALFDSINR
jgi:hypothetical protein